MTKDERIGAFFFGLAQIISVGILAQFGLGYIAWAVAITAMLTLIAIGG